MLVFVFVIYETCLSYEHLHHRPRSAISSLQLRLGESTKTLAPETTVSSVAIESILPPLEIGRYHVLFLPQLLHKPVIIFVCLKYDLQIYGDRYKEYSVSNKSVFFSSYPVNFFMRL